jgi:hypothetical protein
MALTRGGLTAASIVNTANGQRVHCMFNPFEYTLTKTNSFEKKPVKGKNAPKVVFKQGGSQILKLTLHFDTQDTGQDVRDLTDPLWDMMMVNEQKENPRSGKSSPPEVAFQWGKLYFKAYITSLNQKFVLFKGDGTPIRCQVDITLEQFVDVNDYRAPQDEERGGAQPPQQVTATAGDRLDNVAAKDGGDASSYRDVAEKNNIDNPLNMRPGQNMRL